MKTKKVLVIGLLAVIISFIRIPGNAEAGKLLDMVTPDYFGADFCYGAEDGIGTDSATTDYNCKALAIKAGKHLKNRRYRIEAAVELARHDTSGLKDKGGNSLFVDIYGFRDFRIPKTTSDFYIGAGVGAGTMFPRHNQPCLGDSGVLGSLGAKAGIRIPCSKKTYLSIEAFYKHISDPFRDSDDKQYIDHEGDIGRNFSGIATGFTAYF